MSENNKRRRVREWFDAYLARLITNRRNLRMAPDPEPEQPSTDARVPAGVRTRMRKFKLAM